LSHLRHTMVPAVAAAASAAASIAPAALGFNKTCQHLCFQF
jgi:hypothetical protein